MTETGQTSGSRRARIVASIGFLVVLLAVSGTIAFAMKSLSKTDMPSTLITHETKNALKQGRGDVPASIIQVYYFHRTMRCPSCEKIEFLAKTAVEEAFAGELSTGGMQWRAVNIDEPDNKHFEDDYRLQAQSVVVSEQRDGKETRWKNLAKVWDLLDNDPEFIRYVQDEVRAYAQGT